MKGFCASPFTKIVIITTGDVYACCPRWLPKPIGNIFHDDNFENMWNSKTANEIRESILDGSFRFCNKEVCHEIISEKIYHKYEVKKRKFHYLRHVLHKYTGLFDQGPRAFDLSYDYSCNLYCKSCRNEKWVLERDKREKIIQFQNAFLHSRYFKDARRLIITGVGEPLASRVFMDLFHHIREEENPDLRIALRTNGILLTPQNWERLKNIHFAIDQVWVSIDAATETTYQELRRGGDFTILLRNLAHLKRLREKNLIDVLSFHFVVQKLNYREMEQFIELSKKFCCDQVHFTQIFYDERSAYTPEEYHEIAVHKPGHPEFMNLKNIINKPVFREPIVNLSNLAHLIDEWN